MNFSHLRQAFTLWALLTALVGGCSESASDSPPPPATTAPPTGQTASVGGATDADPARERRFDSPESAAEALTAALRSYDRKELARIFGAEAGDLISSGDEVADREGAGEFVEQYDLSHELVTESDGVMTLTVGEDAWPLPIPLVRDEASGGWYFDAQAGMDEIINRRVGRNELVTIQACLAFVDAQHEYAMLDPDGNGVHDYARKFVSDPGEKNGLYWETTENEEPSPLGPLLSQASDEGYSLTGSEAGAPRAYHGYRYRMLHSQGADASGGARDYEVNGRMIGGFAAIAYPAEYGAGGIMTFIVNQDGVVYQRDLGADTEKVAGEMDVFNPGSGWEAVEPVSVP